MKYFDLIDELFDFKYLLTEDNLLELPDDMRKNPEDLLVYVAESVVEFDERLRTERNIRIFMNIVKGMQFVETEIESLDELYNLIKFKSKTGSGQDTLITNTCIAARLQDIPEFAPTASGNITPGYPIIAGNIGNLKIVIDPYLKWDENVMIFYEKSEVKVACYIKDIKVENEATFHPTVKSTVTVFKLYDNLPLKIVVKIPTEELI